MQKYPKLLLQAVQKNAEITKRIDTVSVVRPVRPPVATPAEDSMYALVGVVPKTEPTVVATASAIKACFALGSDSPFISPARLATPIIVPVVSKIVINRKDKITAYKLCDMTSEKA